MDKGYVFKLAPGIFGILTYRPTTETLCRIIDTENVYVACAMLAQEFSGTFVPADSDQVAWAKVGATSYRVLRDAARCYNGGWLHRWSADTSWQCPDCGNYQDGFQPDRR
jgi:hypothetical protein